jgi:hypothetical protein
MRYLLRENHLMGMDDFYTVAAKNKLGHMHTLLAGFSEPRKKLIAL